MGDARIRLEALVLDEVAQSRRLDMCDAIAGWLTRVGQLLWVSGALLGPDRAAGFSSLGFGDDQTVGVATVAQIGGELASGATTLLRAGNRYAGAALIRQLVEVEYLAAAFADQHEVASQWLRSDREARRRFWSPARLRERSSHRFLKTDYWHHCELGGHPATPGMALLPDHSNSVPAAFLAADLVGHLLGIWRGVHSSLEQVVAGPPPIKWELPDVRPKIDEWLGSDDLYAAFQNLGAEMAASDSQAPDHDEPS